MPEKHLDAAKLIDLSMHADELILSSNMEDLRKFFDLHNDTEYQFENLIDKAHYYYLLGNCASTLFSYRNQEWFSDDLSKSVIFYRKALHALQQEKYLTDEQQYLLSCVETNLGNCLSSQGRSFCCIPVWDQAIERKNNPVAITAKARNELFIAQSLYDQGHSAYHYFKAYNLINLGLENIDRLYPEQREAFAQDGELMNFKSWFEDNFTKKEFDYFESHEDEFETREQQDYLDWCSKNVLFLNDLNDVCKSQIVYQDIMTMPSVMQKLNSSLSMHEELMYHGNFDELKNDFCYARYLVFSARNIPNDETHFFNQTYPHVNDMSYTISNLKAHHYKSAFRTLYSLFDKIAYLLNRFFDLNDIGKDHKISFDSIFRKLENRKEWEPHEKLKSSNNYFIHALFYILKDIRDVKDSTSVTKWLDPDAKAFSEMRNAMEHRSLKIADDFGYSLLHFDAERLQSELEQLESSALSYEEEIRKLNLKIKTEKNCAMRSEMEAEMLDLESKLKDANEQIYEKKKLSTHSLLIPESEFKSRLMTLMKLARNSIMYLSMAIHLEEKGKPKNDALIMSKKVPLR
ncbi:LA2681 family HEPN domain-containing protein [Alteromonas sp. a30]|uniref:LA2681 family HEPN domain-containing protein n=1 Tax=Alteromonas sp. a30 TaxID=2730917 RepID=UPI00227EF113|nr:LA2681 family HEPN domain-containing protein [Alteromonas sp. a30]MCY7296744.1 hypothetical protein [Alteromonas sp. a30]